jgi:hypothetical protein
MSDLADTKKKMGQAIKTHLTELKIPSEQSRKISSKMRLEVKLKSGADLTISCVEVKGGRMPGSYGLYWLIALSGGVIYDVMKACDLAAHPTITSPLIFSCTSHNLPSASHFEVTPSVDFEVVAAAICRDIREQSLPIIEGFDSEPNRGLDYILKRGPGIIRNPFTTCVVLMHLAKRTDRLDEIINVASTAKGFYDFKGATEAETNIIEPLNKWFISHRV